MAHTAHIEHVADSTFTNKSDYQKKRDKAMGRGGVLLGLLVALVMLARWDHVEASEIDDENYLPSPQFIEQTQPWSGEVRVHRADDGNIHFVIDADENDAVTYVELYIDGHFAGRDLHAPYKLKMPARAVSNRKLELRVYDAHANETRAKLATIKGTGAPAANFQFVSAR